MARRWEGVMMMRSVRAVLLVCVCGGIPLVRSRSVRPAISAADRPNFVFILVDDLGYMDIGANNPDTSTKHPTSTVSRSRGCVSQTATRPTRCAARLGTAS